MSWAGMLLDVDGTLVDTNYLHTVAWARAFRKAGIEVPMSTIHRHVGMGSDKMIQSLAGREDSSLSDAHSREYAQFRGDVHGFPAAGDLLRELHSRGLRVVLATSAKEDDMPVLMKAIGADDAIDEIVTSKEVEESKPAPDIFKVALERAGLEAARTLTVGDSVWDVEASERIGVRCLGVCTGGTSRDELERAGATAVYDDVADLLQKLDQSPIAELLR